MAANPASEDTQIEIGDKLNAIKDILLAPAAIVLNGLSDVNIENPTDGQTLKYNIVGHKWENIIPSGTTGYVDRGDPSSWDYSKTDFTTDGQWHVLNLSSIVPEGATVVHLSVYAYNAYAESWIFFCKKGIVNRTINREAMHVHHGGNIEYYESKWVACDSDRKIEYWMTNRTWGKIDLLVRGWM